MKSYILMITIYNTILFVVRVSSSLSIRIAGKHTSKYLQRSSLSVPVVAMSDSNTNISICHKYMTDNKRSVGRDYLSYKFTRFFIYSLFLSDEGPMLEMLDHTIRIGSTPIFLYD